MIHEYEIITHNNVNFHVFLVNLLYRTPHIHRDYEFCLVLEGSLTLHTLSGSYNLKKNDIFIANPFFSHEIQAKNHALILSLQVSPSLFSSYYPRIKNTQFDISVLHYETNAVWCQTIQKLMIDIAISYFNQEQLYELKCVMLLNQLFQYLLKELPSHLVSENERLSKKTKAKRMQSIIEYIDEHYTEKLLLTDIAAQLKLDLYYLSHFFKESFGISFQKYLLKIRCEHARQLILSSELSLLDISIASGFSDPKYFNKGFRQQFGCPPKEYRKNFRREKTETQKKLMSSVQEFLSDISSIIALDKIK